MNQIIAIKLPLWVSGRTIRWNRRHCDLIFRYFCIRLNNEFNKGPLDMTIEVRNGVVILIFSFLSQEDIDIFVRKK